MNSTPPTLVDSNHPPLQVLVVDDESALLKLLVMVLQFQGHEVLAAESPAQALIIARGRKDKPIDLLITDLAMPGMTGDILAGELIDIFPTMKVIFTSGYFVDAPMILRFASHNSIYLRKPVNSKVWGQTIGALFEAEAA